MGCARFVKRWHTGTCCFCHQAIYSFLVLFALYYFYNMADVHSKETRSYNMSRIRSKDTKPELLVRRFLHKTGSVACCL